MRYLSNIAITRSTLLLSTPIQLLCGNLYFVLLSKTSIFAKTGLPLSSHIVKTLPGMVLEAWSILSLMSYTGWSQNSVISNIPLSSVCPNLFFCERRNLSCPNLSPSRYKTTSTMCSRYFGPAISPHLVTCHIIIMVQLCFFPNSESFSAQYFT